MQRELHPIRAFMAVSTWTATIYYVASGIVIPDAWWALVSGINIFYFVAKD